MTMDPCVYCVCVGRGGGVIYFGFVVVYIT
jgi:hypothetical protein